MQNSRIAVQKFALLACTLILLGAASASATTFSIFGTFQDTDDLDEAFGGGIGASFPLGEVVALDLRASYLEELDDDPLRGVFDDDPVFEPNSVRILPVDIGVRFDILRQSRANPYVGVGGTYYFLDADRFGFDVDDELGYYGLLGARLGDDVGPAFFVEGIFRKVEGSFDNNDLSDPQNDIPFDLDGFGLNAGVRWTF